MIPLLQGRLVGKFYDNRIRMRMLAGQNGCMQLQSFKIGNNTLEAPRILVDAGQVDIAMSAFGTKQSSGADAENVCS